MGAIYLVRHGQASFGSDDYDRLSELGFEQSEVTGRDFAARGIEPDVVLHGRMRRQRETAETMHSAAGWSCPLEVVNELDEYDVLEALAAAEPEELETLNSGVSTKRFQDVLDGALMRWTDTHAYAEYELSSTAAIGGITARAGSGRSVVVVSSAGTLSLAVARLLSGIDLTAEQRPDPGLWIRLQRVAVNAAATRVVSGRGGQTLIAFNEHQHLENASGDEPRRLVTVR